MEATVNFGHALESLKQGKKDMPTITEVTLTYDDGTTVEINANVLVARYLPDDISMDTIGLNEEQIQHIGNTLADPESWEDIEYV